jgi:UDP-glucose 4-epimerase
MRILITGGNGYVGRELTRLLYGAHEVCVADALRYGKNRFTENERARFRFEKIDITSSAQVSSLVSDFKPETIIHLAAIHYIPECENNPALTAETNVQGTINLLLAAPARSRFVFASSGAVYMPDGVPHQEVNAAIQPSDVYGLSKLHGEQWVRYLARERRLSSVVVRLFNVVGPGETNPHLVPELVAQLKAGRLTIRLGNLSPKRDYIHVQDAARGFMATALNHELAPEETVTVNLGTSHPYSVAEIVRKLRRIAGVKFSLEQDRERVRAVDRPYLAADNALIKRVFGWVPLHTIDEALTDLWREPDLTDALMAKYR